jgi:tRNA-dihydrouridine synthase
MLQPELVARCMAALAGAAQGTPVTVKCRLGVDQVRGQGEGAAQPWARTALGPDNKVDHVQWQRGWL